MGRRESPTKVDAPIASRSLPVGIREERATFFYLGFCNSSFLKDSYDVLISL